MIKKSLVMLATAMMFLPSTSWAEKAESESVNINFLNAKMRKVFAKSSDLMGDNSVAMIKLPEVKLSYFYIDENQIPREKNEKIPSQKVKIAQIEPIGDKMVYQMSSDSVDFMKLYAYWQYNEPRVDVGSSTLAISFAPRLNRVVGFRALISDYSKAFIDGGQKITIGNINYQLSSELKGGEYISKNIAETKDFRLNGILGGIYIPRIVSNVINVYDFANLQTGKNNSFGDFNATKSSRNKVKADNIELEIMGQKLTGSLLSAGQAVVDFSRDAIDFSGKTNLVDWQLPMMAELGKFNIKFKYGFRNITFSKISEIVEQSSKIEKLADKSYDEFNESERAELADLADKINGLIANMVSEIKIDSRFEKGAIKVEAELQRKQEYFVGQGQVVIENLDNLAPDYEALCQKDKLANPNSESENCQQFGIRSFLKSYIETATRTTDTQGNTLDTVKVKFTEDGIYIGDNKIADPLKFNIKEILEKMADETDSVDLDDDELDLQLVD